MLRRLVVLDSLPARSGKRPIAQHYEHMLNAIRLHAIIEHAYAFCKALKDMQNIHIAICKAEVIMALAGSTGGSWSTTYAQRPVMSPSAGKVKVHSEEIQRQISSFPLSIQGNPEHALSQVDRTTLTRDIPSLTAVPICVFDHPFWLSRGSTEWQSFQRWKISDSRTLTQF
ncbi:hypothetical protein IEQ34_017468 [Dendrobium chrysotoxum]|uniref:Uncharacterized protein n=1 Tax=Dendrobium chrysotoxum TaxID=161865 RepID=A0AAV7GBD9_DENCH|nr:hypothetical protein IEQ34_017468 [Dendrobium chrysotoxum]